MSRVAITGVGMISPVGFDAPTSCAAVRAGLSRLREHPDLYRPREADPPPREPRPLVASSVPRAWPSSRRPAELGVAASRDLMRRHPLDRARAQETPLWIAAEDASTSLRLQPFQGAPERCGSGRGAMLAFVAEAAALIRSGRHERALVVGADSHLSHSKLRALDEARRLKSDRNPAGFVPGEAGVALLLESAEAAAARGVAPLGWLGAAGHGREPQPWASRRPSTGEGLSRALGAVGPTTWVVADLNGEPHRSRELSITLSRLGAGAVVTWYPAACLGDVGCASGGVQVVVACWAWARGHAPPGQAAITVVDDTGDCWAIALVAPGCDDAGEAR